MDRYVVTTVSGQPVIRTNSLREATRYQHVLRGRIVDRGERATVAARPLAVAS